jgi:hypothetical protein
VPPSDVPKVRTAAAACHLPQPCWGCQMSPFHATHNQPHRALYVHHLLHPPVTASGLCSGVTSCASSLTDETHSSDTVSHAAQLHAVITSVSPGARTCHCIWLVQWCHPSPAAQTCHSAEVKPHHATTSSTKDPTHHFRLAVTRVTHLLQHLVCAVVSQAAPAACQVPLHSSQ